MALALYNFSCELQATLISGVCWAGVGARGRAALVTLGLEEGGEMQVVVCVLAGTIRSPSLLVS